MSSKKKVVRFMINRNDGASEYDIQIDNALNDWLNKISYSVKDALKIEYRVTSRAQEFADFQEGIRAMIIDKDKSPLWKYPKIDQVPIKKVFDLLKPLSFSNELKI